MLNFNLVKSQIDSMISERKDFAEELSGKIRLACEELRLKSESWQELSRKVDESKTSWLVAGISSPLNAAHPLPERPRWREVLRTAYFVLSEVTLDAEQRARIEALVDEVLRMTRDRD